jgi:S-DNA-T family DNA segregation ATPase FtsK/SpoIIIE
MPPSSDTPLLGWTPLAGDAPRPLAPSAPAQPIGIKPGTPPPGSAAPSAFLSAGTPRFQRAPRTYVELPRTTLEVSAPPALPTKPSTTSGMLIFAIVIALSSFAGMGAYAFMSYRAGQLAAASGQVSPMAQLWWLPLLTGLGTLGGIAGIVQQLGEPRRYRRELARREAGYCAYLDQCAAKLQQQQAEQRTALLTTHPAPATCLQRLEQRDQRLWERTLDRDFGRDLLDLRLGVGTVPASFMVKAPQTQGFQLDADPLQEQAQQLARTYATVAEAPIVLPLAAVGSAGLAGRRSELLDLIRALVVQLATHHAPSEVKLVLCYPEREADAWAWARWLPHVWSDDRQQRFMAATPEAARQMLVELAGVLKQRDLARQDDEAKRPPPAPLYVVLFADASLLKSEHAAALAPLLALLECGPRLGAFALFLHDTPEQVRKECGAVVDLANQHLRLVGPPPLEFHFEPDRVPAVEAESFARTLAPLRASEVGAGMQLPDLLSLLDLLGVRQVEDLPILQNWQTSTPFKSLAAPIGVRAGGDLVSLDFHERGHGPHGLSAGTTGSGKSELLQTLVASLAVRFHPHELAFVLIDYKGGGMAAPFRDLPHQVGIITNLEADLVPRAINALKVENERRQRLLDGAGVSNIDAYQPLYRAGKAPEPLPHLIILVDEFAELAQNQPDLMERLISTARVGRSLGVHLLLATQKPAGVVNDQIWSNSNFRLCLRVAQPEDSQEMLKRPDAAQIPSTRPGRGSLQVGLNEIFEQFQSAYSGLPYMPQASVVRASVAEVALDGRRRPFQHPGTALSAKSGQSIPTQLQALVSHLHQIAQQQQLRPLEPPWMPPLPTQLLLSQVRGGRMGGWDGQDWQRTQTWMQPIIGLLDNPAQRIQEPLSLNLAEGNLAIYGAPGCGKTTLLETIALALVLDHTPDELNLYLVDFGGRRLKLFEPLPHVGGVILPGADEHIARLLFMLLREIEHRKDELVKAGETSFAAYHRRIAGAPPAIVVLLDNYAAFANDYPEQADELIKVASEGGSVGVHLVITAGSSGAIPFRLANSLSLALALELNDIGEYPTIVGRTDGLLPAKGVRGRGLIKATPPLEFQSAITADHALRDQVTHLAQAWKGARARPVPVLPDLVPLDVILTPTPVWNQSNDLTVPVGIDAESMSPLLLDLSATPNLLIVGSPMSGKTTLLQSVLLGLCERYPPGRVQLYLSGLSEQQLQPFSQLPHHQETFADSMKLTEVVTELISQLSQRRREYEEEQQRRGRPPDEREFAARYPTLVLAIDDYDQARSAMSGIFDDQWRELLRLGRRFGLVLLVASPAAYFQSFFGDEVGKVLKEQGAIVLLGGTDPDSLHTFGLRLKAEERNKTFEPGRGYYKRRNVQIFFQSANCQSGAMQLADWIEQIAQKR